jgi:anion-transporting  ArsA/GET3 family ATPase
LSTADQVQPRLRVVVGSGGVGKTTLAAAIGLRAAARGERTLVMTFDPSLRLKDALGVGEAARDDVVVVPIEAPGTLSASLLDARRTFDRLVQRYAPTQAARDRILGNRFYDHLAGSLAGILEYMAVERLFEVSTEGGWDHIVLDTPPTRQALDFLEAPRRIVDFLDSGALKVALKPWFDEQGHLAATKRLGFLGRSVEGFFDRAVGLDLLRDMAEFFQAFGPLFEGFRKRASDVEALLRSPETQFTLVSGPGEERVADTLFFARKLGESRLHLGPVVVNRVHPRAPNAPDQDDSSGRQLLRWLGERDAESVATLRELLGHAHPVVEMPLRGAEPTSLAALDALGRDLELRLKAAGPRVRG